MKKLNQQIGKAIKSLRIQKGLTQEELAELSGIHERYISRMERGMQGISFEYMEKLAKGLKTPVPEIVKIIYGFESSEVKNDREWLIENIYALVQKQSDENLSSLHQLLLQLPSRTEGKRLKK